MLATFQINYLILLSFKILNILLIGLLNRLEFAAVILKHHLN